MNTLSYKTISANKESAKKEWLIVDVENEVVGRAASKIAQLIRGKHKPLFTPHVDCGDNVIVINADKIRFTGSKLTGKEYIRHTGYPGGQRITSPKEVLAKKPTFIIEHAVKGMLPKNSLGRELFRNLYVYVGTEHPHAGQQPKVFNLNSIK